jgi:hypothetical protein
VDAKAAPSEREAALALGIRVAVASSRENDRDPVMWLADQDYRAACCTCLEPARSRRGPEGLGPEFQPATLNSARRNHDVSGTVASLRPGYWLELLVVLVVVVERRSQAPRQRGDVTFSRQVEGCAAGPLSGALWERMGGPTVGAPWRTPIWSSTLGSGGPWTEAR